MNYERRKKERAFSLLIGLFMLLSVMGYGFPLGASSQVYAADDERTVTLKIQKRHYYGVGNWAEEYVVTHVDGQAVAELAEDNPRNIFMYCTDPLLASPTAGTYRAEYIGQDATGYDKTIRKVAYYCLGSAGYSRVTSKKWADYINTFEGGAFPFCHVVLSYATTVAGRSDGDWDALIGTASKEVVKSAYEMIGDLPDPPDSYVCFWVHNPGMQDLIGGMYMDTVGSLSLVKSSSDNAVPFGANYSLKYAEYTLYESDGKTVAKDQDGKKIVLKTDENGAAKYEGIPTGEGYILKETKAPLGFELNPAAISVDIVADTETKVERVKTKDVPKKGKLQILKESSAPGLSAGNAMYSLANAKYAVYGSRSDAASDVKRVAVMTTKDGAVSDAASLFAGTYYVKEVTAAKGFALNETVYQVKVEVDKTTTVKDTAGKNPTDAPQLYGLKLLLEKRDKDALDGTKQGGASLAGAEYEVRYFDNEKGTGTPLRTWTFKTKEAGGKGIIDATDPTLFVSGDALYYDAAGNPVLPLGSVRIKETKAPEGYLIDETEYFVPLVGAANSTTVRIKDFETVISTDAVYRGGFRFNKVKEGTGEALAGIAFKITSKDTGEWTVVVTDKNGIIDTEKVPHSQNTNKNKEAIREDGTIDESKLSAKNGIWFYGHVEPATGAPVDDNQKALPYGEYEVKELATSANEGLNPVTFTVYIEDHDEKIDRGSVINTRAVRIRTTATGEDGAKTIAPLETAKIIDKVNYIGAMEGADYKLVGQLVLAEDPATILATAEKSFTCKWAGGEESLDFTFDAKAYAGKTTVVFERLYLVGEDGEETLVARHEDPTDEGQQVAIAPESPFLVTTAALTDETTITDQVSYFNITDQNEYTIKGWLVDKKTREPIGGAEGKTTFTADGPQGTVQVAIDAKDARGKTVVVFEEAYDNEGNLIAEHKDINNLDQTVEIPAVPDKPTPKEPEKKETPKKRLPVPTTGDDVKDFVLYTLIFSMIVGATMIMLRRQEED